MSAGPLNYRTFEGQCYEGEEKLGVLCFSLLYGVSGLFCPTFQETDSLSPLLKGNGFSPAQD